MNRILFSAFLLGVFFFVPLSVSAGQTDTYTIVIKDHRFNPERLAVPAGQKIKLIIDNQDPTPEEFESHDLNREKVIQGNRQGVILIGPLKSGEYKFVGEFHEDMAKGVIVAE